MGLVKVLCRWGCVPWLYKVNSLSAVAVGCCIASEVDGNLLRLWLSSYGVPREPCAPLSSRAGHEALSSSLIDAAPRPRPAPLQYLGSELLHASILEWHFPILGLPCGARPSPVPHTITPYPSSGCCGSRGFLLAPVKLRCCLLLPALRQKLLAVGCCLSMPFMRALSSQ